MAKVEWVKSFSDNINDLTNGLGYATKILNVIFGGYMSGKSTIMLNEAYHYVKEEGKGVLYIDTEGGFELFVSLMDKTLREKFKLGNKKDVITLKRITDLVELFKYLGMDVNLEVDKDSGRVTVVFQGFTTEGRGKDKKVICPIEDDIRENKIGMLVLDSVTKVVDEKFAGMLKQLPSRRDAYGLLLGRLLTIVEKHNLLCFVIAHESINPTNPYASPDVTGGKMIKHLGKVIYYLEKPSFSAKELSGFRRLYLVRFPNIPEWQNVCILEITDKGVRDSSKKELDELREKLKKEKK